MTLREYADLHKAEIEALEEELKQQKDAAVFVTEQMEKKYNRETVNQTHDNVNHPSHYTSGGIECIDAIRSALGDGFPDYCRGNVLKYLWRYKHKNGVEDVRKATVYLNWLLEYLENERIH